MKKIIISLICILTLLTTVFAGSNTTTDRGIVLEYSSVTTTSSPNRLTIYDAANLITSYANRKTDIGSSQITYTGHVSPDYHLQSYIAVVSASNHFSLCNSSVGTDAVCTINYGSYLTSDNVIIMYCTPDGGCSRGKSSNQLFQMNSGEFSKSGIKLSFTAHETPIEPTAYTLYDAGELEVTNFFHRISDDAGKTVTYNGHLNSNYPLQSFFKIFNKSNPSTTGINCQSSLSNDNCVISYSVSPPSEASVFHMFCNEYGACARGHATFYFGGRTGELSGPGIIMDYELLTDLITSPQYIYPTPTNGARKYNPQNFTIKINSTGNNLDNAIITINSQNYSMENTSEIYYYTYNFTNITSIETVTFQVHYNKSGTVNSIDQRTAYAYPPRDNPGTVPFATPIIYLISLILILITLSIPLSLKTKSKNKKAIGPVVATALLLVVAVVALVSFQGWYQTYQSDILSKTEGKSNIDSSIIFIERIEQTTTGTNIMIKNQGSAYYVIQNLKINSNECNLLGSDIIGEKAVTTIETDCTSIRNQAAEIAVFTDLGIFSEEEMVK